MLYKSMHSNGIPAQSWEKAKLSLREEDRSGMEGGQQGDNRGIAGGILWLIENLRRHGYKIEPYQ
jgi:hypothetical protein